METLERVVHERPFGDRTRLLCCGRSIDDIPDGDETTDHVFDVTCPGVTSPR